MFGITDINKMKKSKALVVFKEILIALWGAILIHRIILAFKRPLSSIDLLIYFILITILIFFIKLTLLPQYNSSKGREKAIMRMLFKAIFYGTIALLFEHFFLNQIFY